MQFEYVYWWKNMFLICCRNLWILQEFWNQELKKGTVVFPSFMKWLIYAIKLLSVWKTRDLGIHHIANLSISSCEINIKPLINMFILKGATNKDLFVYRKSKNKNFLIYMQFTWIESLTYFTMSPLTRKGSCRI